MRKRSLLVSSALSCLLLASTLTVVNAATTIPKPAKSPKAPCRLEIDDVHISTEALKQGRGKMLKAKVRSICDKYQENVRFIVTYYKNGELGDHWVATKIDASKNNHGLEVDYYSAEVRCVNNHKTTYYAYVTSTATVEGRTMIGRQVRTTNKTTLNCGT